MYGIRGTMCQLVRNANRLANCKWHTNMEYGIS